MGRKLGKTFGTSVREQVYAKTDHRCFYCGKTLNLDNCSIDHLKPLSKGGTDDKENLVASCVRCNRRKSNLTVEEFRFMMGRKNQDIPFFAPNQIAWLESKGFTAHIPDPKMFWWEWHSSGECNKYKLAIFNDTEELR